MQEKMPRPVGEARKSPKVRQKLRSILAPMFFPYIGTQQTKSGQTLTLEVTQNSAQGTAAVIREQEKRTSSGHQHEL